MSGGDILFGRVRMSDPMHILICETYDREVKRIAATDREFDDITFFTFPSRCGRPVLSAEEIARYLPTEEVEVEIIGGCCLSGLSHLTSTVKPWHLNILANCFTLLTDKEVIDGLIREGAFLVTPGWLERWRQRIADWGFDRAGFLAFFHETIKQLHLLDTGVDEESPAQLADFAVYADIPCGITRVGLGFFSLYLKRIILNRRLESERTRARAETTRLHGRLSDYAMALDLFERFSSVQEEDETIRNLLDVFNILFAPQTITYVSCREGKPAGVHPLSGPASKTDAQVEECIDGLGGQCRWNETGDGFILPVARDGETLGVLILERIAFPEYGKHYLNLAHSLIPTCGLAIKNARQYAQIKLMEQQQYQLQKAESLNRMAGAIAHHFNNKLMAVMGNLELAMDHPSSNPEIARRLAAARQAADGAAEVSRLMLTYLGQTVARFESVDLSKACREVIGIQNSLMPEHIALKTDIPPHGPIIRAEPVQVRQILSQLITNAIEAIGEGQGDIRVSIGVKEAAGIDSSHIFPVGWKPKTEACACFEVSDVGCGIDPEQLEQIFDPFYSTKFVGRGLGLAVVVGTLRMHKGAIAVESKPGQGSTFRVFWPLEPPETQPAGPVRP
jgi:signal transduction histidine kinase